jgi:hypothetical protein
MQHRCPTNTSLAPDAPQAPNAQHASNVPHAPNAPQTPTAPQAGADARGEVGTSSAAGDQAEGVGDAQAAPQTDDQSASPAPAAKTRGKAKKEG